MVDKIIKFLYYILFLVTPWVMYPGTSEIFEFNKMLFIYLVTALTAFFWIVKMIINRKIILKKTFLDIPIILFLLSQIASTFFSIDRQTSLFGYYGRFNGGLISILSYIILYYGFVSNSIDFKKILKISIISSLVVILWGLPGRINRDLSCPVFNTVLTATSGQLTGEKLNSIWTTGFNNSCWSRETNVFDPASRMFSTLGQPNWLGAYLSINFFIGLYFLIQSFGNRILKPLQGKQVQDKKKIFLYSTYLFFNFSVILFTRSRSAMISVLAGVAIFTMIYVYKKSKKIFIASLALLFSGLVLLVVFNREKVINYLTLDISPSGITESLDIRKIVWKGAVDLGLRYPIVGSGVETFAYSYFFVRPQAHNLTTEWDFLYNKAHNEYLNYFATTGFVGLFTYLFFIGAFIYYSFKILNFKKTKTETDNNQWLILSLSVAWLTIIITNFFGFSTTTINVFFYLIPAMVVNYSPQVPEKYSGKNKINPYQWLGILTFAVLLIYITFSLVSYFIADVAFGRGVYYSNPKINDYQKAAFYFDRALRLRQEHVYEDKLSYSLAYLSGIASYQQDNQLAGELMKASEYYNLKSLRDSSRNVLYWKTRAKNKYLFYLVNQNKEELYEGIKALDEAARLSPTDPKIPYSQAVFYSLLYDLETDSNIKESMKKLSMSHVETSVKLKKNFDDGLLFKKELLEKYGT